MNIKLKALLIAIAGVFGLFVTLVMIVRFPILLVFAFLAAIVYGVYRFVLSFLEHKERIGKRK